MEKTKPPGEKLRLIPFEEQCRLLEGVVEPGVHTEGLVVVLSDEIVNSREFGRISNAGGAYINRRLHIEENDEPSHREEIKAFLSMLEEEYGICGDRIVILNEGADDVDLRHEIIHDVFVNRPQHQQE
ncbi:MAG: hypothetical protein ABH851_07215, partial [Methanobacteriota archaeon]